MAWIYCDVARMCGARVHPRVAWIYRMRVHPRVAWIYRVRVHPRVAWIYRMRVHPRVAWIYRVRVHPRVAWIYGVRVFRAWHGSRGSRATPCVAAVRGHGPRHPCQSWICRASGTRHNTAANGANR